MVDPTLEANPRAKVVDTNATKFANPIGDTSPNELFKKVVLNDAKQNNRLTAKFRGSEMSNGKDGPAGYSKGPTKMRFMVCTLGLMALAMSQMCRMVINQTITQMIDPSMQAAKSDDTSISSDGSCPWPEEEAVLATTPASVIIQASSPLPTSPIATFEPIEIYPTSPAVNSNVPDDEDLEELPDMEVIMDKEDQAPVAPPPIQPPEQVKNVTVSDGGGYEKFKWTIKQQSVLLGGFYYSYFVFMILGGRLSEVYGAKYVILLSVAGSAVINLATPWMARTSFTLLVISRIIMGAIQSGVFPAMYALIAKWLTMSEASIFAPLIKMNLRVGMVLGSLIPGLVPGWPNIFYATGILSAIWSITWIFVSTSDPADNKWVSPGELAHINRKKRKPKQEENEMIEMSQRTGEKMSGKKAAPSLKTPWLKIWTAPSVIGLIIVKLTFNYALDFLAIELPSYLRYVHHASRQKISAITTPMFGIQVFLIIFVGWLAKVSVQRRPFGMTKTTIRKVFQGIASLGMSLLFFLLTFNDCNMLYVAILLQIVSFLSMFTAGGETMLPYDLSEEYPATIMSIANSIANISGITTTTLAAIVLGDQGGSYDRWNFLIRLVAGANLVGGLAFIILVKAEPIDFESSKSSKESKQPDVETAKPSAPAIGSRDGLTEIKLGDAQKPEELHSTGDTNSKH